MLYLTKNSFYLHNSPNTNDIFEKISNQVANTLNYNVVGLTNSAELNAFLIANNSYVGIEFYNNSNGNLNYALRFQPDAYGWATNKLFAVNKETRAPRTSDVDGGMPYYNNRCFLLIQNTIDRAFIGLTSGKPLPSVTFQRFPYPGMQFIIKLA